MQITRIVRIPNRRLMRRILGRRVMWSSMVITNFDWDRLVQHPPSWKVKIRAEKAGPDISYYDRISLLDHIRLFWFWAFSKREKNNV